MATVPPDRAADSGSAPAAGASSPAPPAARVAPPRKKRRWGRRLLVLFVLLLVVIGGLIAAAPALLSTQFARAYLLAFLNDRLRGRVALEGLALAWRGGNELRGVAVFDPDGREVLAVERIHIGKGLWELAWAPLDTGAIEIDRPRVVLALSDGSSPTLASAFQMRDTGGASGSNPRAADKPPVQPAASAPSASGSALPAIRGQVVIRDGAVRIERLDGAAAAGGTTKSPPGGAAAYDLRALSADVTVDTLDHIAAKVSLALADGAPLRAEVDLSNLAPRGQFDVLAAAGEVILQSDRPIDLEPLLRVVAPGADVAGGVKIDIRTSGPISGLTGDFDVSVSGLRRGAGGTALDAALRGKAERRNGAISARGALQSSVGQIDFEAAAPESSPPSMSGAELSAALLAGAPLRLPEFTIDARGAIDLAKLNAALPGVLNVREGLKLSSGRVELGALQARGGSAPSVLVRAELSDVSGESAGSTVRLQPIKLSISAAAAPGAALTIEKADVEAAFAALTARGDASKVAAELRADLDGLQRELGQVFDFSGLALAGTISGKLAAQRVGDAQIDVTCDVNGTGVRAVSGERRFDVQSLAVRGAAGVALREQKPTRVDVRSLDANLDGRLAARASGWLDLEKSAYQVQADVPSADLAYLAERAAAAGVTALNRYSGQVTLKASAAASGADQPITASGVLTAQNLGADGAALLDGETRVQIEQLQVRPDGSQLALSSLQVNSSAGNVTARDVRYVGGDAATLNAKVNVQADVARGLRAAAAAARLTGMPEVGGALALEADVSTTGQKLALTARGSVQQFSGNFGGQQISDPRLDLDISSTLDQAAQRVALERLRFTSQALKLDAAGTLADYRSALNADVRGRYDAQWQPLMAYLHQFVPATASLVELRGASGSEFSLRGPLSQAGATPGFRGASAETAIGFQGGSLWAVGLGDAHLSPRLQDGRLSLAPASISAGGGKINLAGTLDFTAAEPTLRISERLALLDKVQITRELARQVLGFLNPVFMHTARIEGDVSLSVSGVSAPLGASLTRATDGRGALNLSTVKLQPEAFLSELLELVGVPTGELRAVTFTPLEFEVQQGRVRYQQFSMQFDKDIELQFRGSVGLDASLDMIVSLPVREGLLRRLGVGGAALEQVKKVPQLRVDVPLGGTISSPRLDLTKLDTAKLVAEIMKGQIADPGAIGDILKGLQDGQKREPPREEPRRPRRDKP